MAPPPIEGIPAEILLDIFGLFSSIQDIITVCLVCRSWRVSAFDTLAREVGLGSDREAKRFLVAWARREGEPYRRVQRLKFNESTFKSRIEYATLVAVLEATRPTVALDLAEELCFDLDILGIPAVQGIQSLTIGERSLQYDSRPNDWAEGRLMQEEWSPEDVKLKSRFHLRHLSLHAELVLPPWFFNNLVVGSGASLVSLALLEIHSDSNNTAHKTFDHLAPQLETLTVSQGSEEQNIELGLAALRRCTRLKHLRLSRYNADAITEALRMVHTSIYQLDLDFGRSLFGDPGWRERPFAGSAPPFITFLDFPALASLKIWGITRLGDLELVSGVGAEWKRMCEARGIEVCEVENSE